ncbi:MAG: hypothetical protein JW787_11175 [Sedimentisphaerales bacterium]|nr:hypothetical protein [Sedimentisphaerales bacterium]
MTEENSKSWRLNRQVNVSVIVQLVLLTSMILGSWINLQRQLYLLQKDVSVLLSGQEKLEDKIESLWSKSISHEYRLQTIEKNVSDADRD